MPRIYTLMNGTPRLVILQDHNITSDDNLLAVGQLAHRLPKCHLILNLSKPLGPKPSIYNSL